MYDSTSLSQRLQQVADIKADERNRGRPTTLPVPNVAMPPEFTPLLSPAAGTNNITKLPYQQRQQRAAAELLEVRVRQALWPGTNAAAKDHAFPEPLQGDPNDVTTDAGKVHWIMQQILAPELAAGVRLNINRPLGNGRDDPDSAGNYNGVVDEPGEEGTGVVGTLPWPTSRSNPLGARERHNGMQASSSTPISPMPSSRRWTPTATAWSTTTIRCCGGSSGAHLYVAAMTMITDPVTPASAKPAGGRTRPLAAAITTTPHWPAASPSGPSTSSTSAIQTTA
jgi:hypothetical protein